VVWRKVRGREKVGWVRGRVGVGEGSRGGGEVVVSRREGDCQRGWWNRGGREIEGGEGEGGGGRGWVGGEGEKGCCQ